MKDETHSESIEYRVFANPYGDWFIAAKLDGSEPSAVHSESQLEDVYREIVEDVLGHQFQPEEADFWDVDVHDFHGEPFAEGELKFLDGDGRYIILRGKGSEEPDVLYNGDDRAGAYAGYLEALIGYAIPVEERDFEDDYTPTREDFE